MNNIVHQNNELKTVQQHSLAYKLDGEKLGGKFYLLEIDTVDIQCACDFGCRILVVLSIKKSVHIETWSLNYLEDVSFNNDVNRT